MGEVIKFVQRSDAPNSQSSFSEAEILRNSQTYERSCMECRWALFGQSGTFCRLYNIDVWDEVKEAESCEDFAT